VTQLEPVKIQQNEQIRELCSRSVIQMINTRKESRRECILPVRGSNFVNMARTTKQVSIDLAKYKGYDDMYNRKDDSEEEDEVNMFEAARQVKTTWGEGGKAKDKVLNTVISRFSMLIHKNELEVFDQFDDVPVEEIYSKLPTVLKSLTKLIL